MAQLKDSIVSGDLRVTGQIYGQSQSTVGIEIVRGTQSASTGSWTGVTRDPVLYDGKMISYYLPYAGSGNATLNLTLADGTTTGAKNCYYNSTTRLTTHFGAYSQFTLVYHKSFNINGTNYEGWWLADRGYDTTNIGQLRLNYSCYQCTTQIGRYSMALTKYNSVTQLIPVNAVDNSTATTKTLTTDIWDPFGEVYYFNQSSATAANTTLANYVLYPFTGVIDLRYAFNTGSTLTANKTVYIVGVPQSGGGCKLDSTPIVQALPSSADGKVYKAIGQAYDTYRIQLFQHKPVYWYCNGKICEYTGTATGTATAVTGLSTTSFTPKTGVSAPTGTAAAASYASGILTITNGSTPVTSVSLTNGTAITYVTGSSGTATVLAG